MSEKDKSFEEAMQDLEAITTKMQDKNLSLENSIQFYEQGRQLIKYCQNKLKEVEQKIQILNKDEELEDFKIDDL